MMRIALVDDHAVFREGYRAVLSRQGYMQVVDAASAYEGRRGIGVDIVVIDLNLPGESALQVLLRLHKRQPTLASLVFSMYDRAGGRRAPRCPRGLDQKLTRQQFAS